MTRDRAKDTRLTAAASGRGRRAWRMAARLAAIAVLAAPLASCTAAQTTGVASSYLIIDQLLGAAGAEPDQMDGTLQSDVLTDGSIFEDGGAVSFSLGLKDPGITSPSPVNSITVTRYQVRYVRTDGRNTPGVDVPYPFESGMTVTVGESGATASLILVRLQAKLEQPLLALRALGGQVAISTIAEVTFFGKDQAGREVIAEGKIGINFADWADPED